MGSFGVQSVVGGLVLKHAVCSAANASEGLQGGQWVAVVGTTVLVLAVRVQRRAAAATLSHFIGVLVLVAAALSIECVCWLCL